MPRTAHENRHLCHVLQTVRVLSAIAQDTRFVFIIIGAYELCGILSTFTGERKIFAFCVNLII